MLEPISAKDCEKSIATTKIERSTSSQLVVITIQNHEESTGFKETKSKFE
jgi:hypothetical protein